MDEGLSLRDAPAGLDARGAAVSRRIVGALVAAFVLRGPAWLFSFLIVGPVTGAVSFAVLSRPLGPDGRTVPIVVEVILTEAVVAFSIVVAVRVRRDPQRWLGRALVFGWALAVQTIFYVVSLVVVVLIWGGLSNLADFAVPIAVVAALNIPLLLLARSIVRQAAPRSPSG